MQFKSPGSAILSKHFTVSAKIILSAIVSIKKAKKIKQVRFRQTYQSEMSFRRKNHKITPFKILNRCLFSSPLKICFQEKTSVYHVKTL